MQNSLQIGNFYVLLETLNSFLMTTHLFTCAVITARLNYIESFEGQAAYCDFCKDDCGDCELFFDISDATVTYSNLIYYVTTTMTTVGYGDYYAKRYILDMIMIMSIQFLAMLTFSNQKESVFSLKSYATINDYVDEATSTTNQFLA